MRIAPSFPEVLRPTSRGVCNGSPALHLPAFWIRATALLLAIPEHEVSEQARRSEREVGLAFSVAYWSPNSDSTAPLLDPRLHMITVLGVAQGAIFEHFARSILPARVNEPAEKL